MQVIITNKIVAMQRYELIKLPYEPNALEPVISRETIEFHHGKHLQGYVNNLNAAIEGTPFAEMSLEEVVKKSEGGVFNNAGQILNHNMYFTQFRAPRPENAPTGWTAESINKQFGSFDVFKEEFVKKGVSLFGSGWVWLSTDPDGKLVITQETNANNPVQRGLRPLLTFDVWEHAYYIDYRNRRADHLSALWQIVDWDEINNRW